MPWPGRARGRERSRGGARATTNHGCYPTGQRFFYLLGTDEVDMGVDSARGGNHPFSGNHFGTGPNHNRDAGLDVGVACFADGVNMSVFNADIGFYNASDGIDDECIGDDGIDAVGADALALPHAIPNDFATTEFHFLAENGEVVLHLRQ